MIIVGGRYCHKVLEYSTSTRVLVLEYWYSSTRVLEYSAHARPGGFVVHKHVQMLNLITCFCHVVLVFLQEICAGVNHTPQGPVHTTSWS